MTWEPSWIESSATDRSALAWRGVEAQHVVSTMRLVDSPEEQDLLEQLLETSKPAIPETDRPKHYLLATPFRYSPAHESRFRKANAKGQWYGAMDLYAACAEVAYWRYRFVLDSAGLVGEVLLTEHTFFQGQLSGRSIDLTSPPWNACRALWTDGLSYRYTHELADAAQAHKLQWLTYESVRAPEHRCVVAFDLGALSEPPGGLDGTMQTWRCKAAAQRVWMTRGRDRHVWDF